ncbi:hypothetical protein [Marinobacter daepoensis]|uniref:hypothetical protein n=1 Tax=Marinobacter daepoensis TaxID=262077 RepID=UPI0003FC395B|nr:hypothetical protein [Marinobacter daepoensis]
MKQSLIYPATLSLLLAVSPSYGDQWERQLDAQAMAHSESMVSGGVRHDWSEIQTNRLQQLERGAYPEPDVDINNLPPTAAGPQGDHGMKKDWGKVEANRRMKLERGMY